LKTKFKTGFVIHQAIKAIKKYRAQA